jgi:hypothetical protein
MIGAGVSTNAAKQEKLTKVFKKMDLNYVYPGTRTTDGYGTQTRS